MSKQITNGQLEVNCNEVESSKKTPKPVPFWKLYRYATSLDMLLLLLGVALCIIAGVCYPVILYIVGVTLDEFINYAVTVIITTDNYTSNDYFCNIADNGKLLDYITTDDRVGMLRDETAKNTYYIWGIALLLFVSASMCRFLWSISASCQARNMRLNYFKSVLTRHVGWFDINSPAELPTHLSQSLQTIETAIGRSVSTVFVSSTIVVMSFGISFVINWKLTASTLSFLLVTFVVTLIIQKFVGIFAAKKQISLTKAGSIAEEVITAIKTVKAFGGQNKESERYNSHLKQVKQQSLKITVLISLMASIILMVNPLFAAVAYWYGAILFVGCSITAGEIIVIVSEIGIALSTIFDVLPELTQLFAAMGSAGVVYEVIDQESEINPDSDAGIIPDSCEGSIQFSDVIFSYPSRPDVQILHGLDLSVKPGQTVALVGPTGCGKSTISKLIPRIYDITEGTILLDEIDVRDFNISWLRNQIGIVSQEPVLFNVSIAENISYGKEDATIEEIEKAAKFANAHDFISELPDGYNTIVGEGGSQLSGGQKQRVAIARALVRDPKILLLDEATSALDTESEKVVQDALDKAREGRTTIIIAHRLSTIQTADVIICIDNGCVVEMGSHNELKKKEGLYYLLVLSQKIEKSKEKENASSETKNQSLERIVFAKPFDIESADKFSTGDEVLHEDKLTNLTEESTDDSSCLLQEDVTSDPTFDKKKNTLSIMTKVMILCFKKRHWFFLVLAILISFFVGILYVCGKLLLREMTMYFSKTDKDDVLNGIHFYSMILLVVAVVQLIFNFISVNSLGICEEQVCEKVRQKSFRAVVKQDINWFDKPQNSVSVLTHKLSVEASDIIQVFDIRVGYAYKTLAVIITCIIIAFVLTWVIGLIVILSYPLLLIGGYLQVIFTKRYSDKKNQLIEDSAKVAIESIENVYTVATLSIENRLARKYNQLLEQPFRYDLKGAAINGFMYGFSQFVIPVFVGVGFIVGTYLYTADEDKVYYADYPNIFTALVLVLYSGGWTRRFFDVLPDSQVAVSSANSFIKLILQRPVIEKYDDDDGFVPDEVKGDLKMQQIYFTYSTRPGVNILQYFNISITPGHTLALVGPSGSGKSTVISLAERFYDPKSGDILLDGVDLRDLNISWLRRQISLVSQEPILFDMSIADNIRYGALFREVSDKEVMEAAQSANIHDFIQSLPEGYNTNVGLKGTQLSGGQKQRVAIARALVRDPKILLLDEATSALDTESEKVVQDALDRAKKGRTTIIIAHRLSTIYNSDSIAVIDKGYVIEQGTHSELMAQQGVYYFMNNIQTQERQIHSYRT